MENLNFDNIKGLIFHSDKEGWISFTHTRIKNHPYEKFKRDMLRSVGKKCRNCEKTFSEYDLALDHIIPIALGGAINKISNFQILCRRCHRKKTAMDVRIITHAKKMGWITTLYPSIYEIHKRDIQ